MKGLSLAIIAKNEVDQIKRISEAYGKYFEEVVVAWDDEEVPEIKGVRFVPYKWQNDFSHKRNFLAEHIKTDYYMRIDTDDSIADHHNIPSLFNKVLSAGADCINVPYMYGVDDDGNCIAKHWRETIIKKKDGVYWKKAIHENIFVEDGVEFNNANDNSITIIHHTDNRHSEDSFQRNFRMLLDEFNRDKEDTDPRTIAYIGRMLMGIGQWQKAVYFLEKLVEKSGWDDDKYFAYTELAFCHLQLNNLDKSVSACFEALSINPDFPDAHICMGEVYIRKQDFPKAITWLNNATSKKSPDTMYVIDPSRYTVRLAISLAMAYFGAGDFDKAKTLFDRVERISPHNQWIKENKKLFSEGVEQDRYMRTFRDILNMTKEKDSSKVVDLVKSIPREFMLDERVQKLRHDYLPPKKWGDKSIVIYCWQTLSEWAAPSVINGISGSEEAVIYLSEEFKNLGYDVTVFCHCGDLRGNYNGVEYKEFFEFNPKDEFNIIIAWRNNIFFNNIKAKTKLSWFHDVFDKAQERQWFTNTDVDKVIVLSQAHADLVPKDFDKSKVFISSNGINIKDFQTNGVLRNPYRMIYTSSYDRGIQHLLGLWPEVKKEVPEAELHIFYGWELFDKLLERGHRSPEFKEKMVQLMSQDGIYEHGMIGHKRLVKEMQKSKFFVYPSHFYEISCISAMKAQACGCVPVVTDYAALKETVKDGVFVKGNAEDPKVREEYKNALIKALREQPEINVDKEQFSWSNVAKQWEKELFNVKA